MKAILMIDMPENCVTCGLMHECMECHAASIDKKSFDEAWNRGTRPKGCPLIPMTEHEEAMIMEVLIDVLKEREDGTQQD